MNPFLDDEAFAWRDIPLSSVLPKSRTRERLEAAGYDTAGKLLATPPDVIAGYVIGVGPIRAREARHRVLDAVQAMRGGEKASLPVAEQKVPAHVTRFLVAFAAVAAALSGLVFFHIN